MMAVAIPFTAYHNSPNKSVRQAVARRGVVLHHAAMLSLDGLRRLAMGAKQVSATAICKDENFERMMDDGWRAWSLSDAYWDSALRSVETCNESTDGWTISDASHWALARGVAYWASVDGFYPHRSGDPKTWTVIGHREVYTIHGGSYATACPGGMDLDLVVRRAQQILVAAAGGDVTLIEEEDLAKTVGIYWTDANGEPVYALLNPASGFWNEWTGVDGAYNNRIAAAFDTGSFALVSRSHAFALKRDLVQN